MASITFSGQLDQAMNEAAAAGNKILFIPQQTVGEVLPGAASELVVESDGSYSITLAYNTYSIYHYSDVTKKKTLIANSVVVSADTTVSTIPDLIGSTIPVTEDSVLTIQGYLTRAEDAASSAADSESNTEQLIANYVPLSIKDQVNVLTAKMSKGETVNMCGYGDSTTAGVGTTGYVANTFGTDHNLNAPNAWPAKLQELLRDIYDNENINVWNAGFSGEKINDGWALENYDNAITNNEYYGTPDLTFVAFGWNDTADDDFLQDHIDQTRLLLNKIIGYGTVPVLITCDPGRVNGTGNNRSNVEVMNQIDAAKRDICKEYGIQLIDMNESVMGWINNNGDGYNWYNVQLDSLHLKDAGNRFKAQTIAANICNNIIHYDGGRKDFNSWDPKFKCDLPYATGYTSTGSKFGSHPYKASGVTLDDELMTAYIMCTTPNAYLVYRAVRGDLYELGGSYTTKPRIEIEKVTSEETLSVTLPTAGMRKNLAPFMQSDEYINLGKLEYGLNKITYKAGDFGGALIGHWSIYESNSLIPSNSLVQSGEIYVKFEPGDGYEFYTPSENNDMSNIALCEQDGSMSFYIECELDPSVGLIMLSGRNLGTENDYDENYLYLAFYRNAGGNSYTVYELSGNGSGGVSYIELFNVTSEWLDGIVSFKYEQVNNGDGTFTHNIYSDEAGEVLVTSYTSDLENYSMMTSGVVGGFYSNTSAISDNVVGKITKLRIDR